MVSDPRNKENEARNPPNNGFGDKIECQLPGHIWDARFCSKSLVWEAVGSIFMVSDPRNKENQAHSPPNHGFGDKIKCQLPGHIWDASFCSKTLVWEAVGYIFMVSGPRN